MKLSRHLVLFATATLLTAACGSDAAKAPASSEAAATTSTAVAAASTTTVAVTTSTAVATTTATVVAVDTLAGAKKGPFGVGRSTITITDAKRNRPLTVDVWYPIDPKATGTPARYAFTPEIFTDSKEAIADEPLANGGPYPLVVYSHGSGGVRYIASYFTERLASHGFVVAAPDHTGNTAVERITNTSAPGEQIAYDRPLDVSAVIDGLLAPADDAAKRLSKAIDRSRIGVTGHSFGGYTALAIASGHSGPPGATAADPRVKAIIGMAPASGLLSDAELSAIKIPTMLIVGTKDTTTPVDPQTTRPFSLITSSPVYKVEMTDAAHQSFTDLCSYGAALRALPNVPQVILDTVDRKAVRPALCPSTAPTNSATPP
jgi:predicted dienelactone hydrolase